VICHPRIGLEPRSVPLPLVSATHGSQDTSFGLTPRRALRQRLSDRGAQARSVRSGHSVLDRRDDYPITAAPATF